MADDAQLMISAAQEVIHLWPEGPPDPLPNVGPEQTYRWPAAGRDNTLMLRNVTDPTLTVFAPQPGKANGTGVVVCPGGGWRILAWEHEGVELAHWLAEHGYTAFLLKYRVMATPDDPEVFKAGIAASNAALDAKRPASEAPRSLMRAMTSKSMLKAVDVAATDGRRAVAIVRERARDWGVDPAKVGMIGFSAGAFLCTDVAMDPQGPPLAFVAPIYGGETLKAEVFKELGNSRVDLLLMLDHSLDQAFSKGTGGGLGAVQRPELLGFPRFDLPLEITGKEILNGGLAAFAASSSWA